LLFALSNPYGKGKELFFSEFTIYGHYVQDGRIKSAYIYDMFLNIRRSGAKTAKKKQRADRR
jgi:hypothetical protein